MKTSSLNSTSFNHKKEIWPIQLHLLVQRNNFHPLSKYKSDIQYGFGILILPAINLQSNCSKCSLSASYPKPKIKMHNLHKIEKNLTY